MKVIELDSLMDFYAVKNESGKVLGVSQKFVGFDGEVKINEYRKSPEGSYYGGKPYIAKPPWLKYEVVKIKNHDVIVKEPKR